MSFMNKLLNSKKQEDIRKRDNIGKIPVLQSGANIDMGNFMQLFSACIGKTLANQIACSEQVVKGQNWSVDFQKGIIAFGDSIFPVQFIGSESSVNNTWLWAWGNKSPLPDSVKVDAIKLKAIGEKYGFSQLTTAQLDIDEVITGHALSIIAAALHEENVCYYRGPHANGAIFVIVKDLPVNVFKQVGSDTFIELVMKIIQQYELDHKVFIESFLLHNNCRYLWESNVLAATFPEERKVYVKLDECGRIASIRGI